MANEKSSGYRWVVVTLLFFATTINYIDRQIIGLLKDALGKDFNWTETDYSHIVMWFNAAYALGNVLFGIFIDRIGSKKGYTLSIIFWSLAASAHALVKSTTGFIGARVALGLGESGNFPSAIRSITEWFPKRERAFATGIFNSGTNIGAVVGPYFIFLIYNSYGWRMAFFLTGVIGFVWLIFWLLLYQVPAKHKRVNPAELAYIHSDEGEAAEAASGRKISWGRMFGIRQTWAFIAGKFFTDPVWWFYLFWIPDYFNTTYHINIKSSWVFVSTIYFIATFGSVLGGFLSGWFIKRGMPVYRARKTAMFLYAVCVLPVFFIQNTSNPWSAVVLVSLAAAAHQAWSANIFTTASDMFPKSAISSVVGLGTMAGATGSILFPMLIGAILDHFKKAGNITPGYNIIFIICSCAYILAWLVMHLLAPQQKKVEV